MKKRQSLSTPRTRTELRYSNVFLSFHKKKNTPTEGNVTGHLWFVILHSQTLCVLFRPLRKFPTDFWNLPECSFNNSHLRHEAKHLIETDISPFFANVVWSWVKRFVAMSSIWNPAHWCKKSSSAPGQVKRTVSLTDGGDDLASTQRGPAGTVSGSLWNRLRALSLLPRPGALSWRSATELRMTRWR